MYILVIQLCNCLIICTSYDTYCKFILYSFVAPDDHLDMSEGHLVQWLSHVDLESVALNSTKELLNSVDKLRHGKQYTSQKSASNM